MTQATIRADLPGDPQHAAPPTSKTSARKSSTSARQANRDSQVLEINTQMSSLEQTVEQLNKKLNSTNRKIKNDVERLTISDADITEKVGETYRQLGIIEHDFASLQQSSTQVVADMKKVNQQVRKFEKESTAALTQAIEQQSVVNADFRQEHRAIIERAEDLSKKVSRINKKLEKSARDNQQAITDLETRVISELKAVASEAQTRDDDLGDKIVAASDELTQQKAKMLILQQVDQALEKRATHLETTTEHLIADGKNLKQATHALQELTTKLVSDVKDLELHSAQLALQNQQQQEEIDNLQLETSSLDQAQQVLARTERRHFGMLGSISLLIIASVIILYWLSQLQRDNDLILQQEQVTGLQSEVQSEQLASRNLEQEVEQLQNQMLGINDQIHSLDGRVQYLAPLYNFGSDNTIHGPHTLAQLKPDHYSIRVAAVSQQSSLYDIAQRYSSYFQQGDLSYFVDSSNQFVLIYGGNYPSEQQAKSVLENLPRYVNFERISIITNNRILEQLR